jgi:hypothetical protein
MTEASTKAIASAKKERISQIDDFLVAFATGWGHKSAQDPLAGTYFVQVLHDVIASKSSKGVTIEQLLKKVRILELFHYRRIVRNQMEQLKNSMLSLLLNENMIEFFIKYWLSHNSFSVFLFYIH